LEYREGKTYAATPFLTRKRRKEEEEKRTWFLPELRSGGERGTNDPSGGRAKGKRKQKLYTNHNNLEGRRRNLIDQSDACGSDTERGA